MLRQKEMKSYKWCREEISVTAPHQATFRQEIIESGIWKGATVEQSSILPEASAGTKNLFS